MQMFSTKTLQRSIYTFFFSLINVQVWIFIVSGDAFRFIDLLARRFERSNTDVLATGSKWKLLYHFREFMQVSGVFT